MDMEELAKTLPRHPCSWIKDDEFSLYKYQDVWNDLKFHELGILAQQSFKAHPSDVFLCSFPKTGTTWLKALAFAIITRDAESTSPLLTTMPHDCIPFLDHEHVKETDINSSSVCIPIKATHINYNLLPKSIIDSNCKIVYIYRNMKDVIVSYYHFLRKMAKLNMEDAPFEDACDEFCQGISWYGPYWDHILGYWKASLERPERFLFLKYEDMKENPTTNVKKLAEFIDRPFTNEEENAGVIENIINLCSFKNLSSLQVNKSEKSETFGFENELFFRKAEDGEWKNYFTDETIEKIDKLIDEKLSGTGLVLK